MIREVIMYRVECSADGCDDSPQENGDYYAWADTGTAHDEAVNGDWFVHDDEHLCPEHAPKCASDDCALTLNDREFGAFCEDHAPEPSGV